ncbi:MAG: T9SS type A sorting domain-containing protein, partial [Bacteroidota bacterium]|nr:T9SS type A sorting domain-containing protein [Bacteroidota bacterium]MDX5431663.1 T9SS type A sorting domain-containing protein [Bacteroidota bacterium]MDX5470381.1 T9SS type A sorting domain-containing protein [Bacteroidota bacterium]
TLICEGESITLTADGAKTYLWSPLVAVSSNTGKVITASPGTPVTYTVEGTDEFGCSNTANVSIEVKNAPASPLIFKSGSRLYVAVQTNVGYQWYRDGQIIEGANSFEHTAVTSGNYEVLLTDSSTGCTTWSREFVSVAFTGLDAKANPYQLYPNPANAYVRLESASMISEYRLYAFDGKLVRTERVGDTAIDISTHDLPEGVYLLEWLSGAGPIHEKIIVHH